MNKVIMMGRFTRDPEIAYGGRDNTAVARFSMAIDKRFKKEGESGADFFNFVAFGKTAEFVEKYFHKGMRALIEGELHNNDYTNKDGQKVRAEQIVVSSIYFCESKGSSAQPAPAENAEGFMDVSETDMAELPFN